MANAHGHGKHIARKSLALGFKSHSLRSIAAASAVLALATAGTVVTPSGRGLFIPQASAQIGQTFNTINPSSVADQPKLRNGGGNWDGTPAVVASQVTGPVNRDAFADGTVKNMFDVTGGTVANNRSGLVSGHVFVGGNRYGTSVSNFSDSPSGVKVYLQWMDRDSAASPVFEATTADIPGVAGGNGTYVFHNLNWIDANGTLHVFQANTATNDVRLKIWAAPGQTGPGGGEYITFRQAPGKEPGFQNASRDGNFGAFYLEPASAQRTAVFIREVPQPYLVSSTITEDNAGPVSSPITDNPDHAISGSVWWETSEPDLNLDYPTSAGEPGADGNRVVLSTLTPEGNAAIATTQSMPPSERVTAQKEILEANPEYIQETVSAPIQGGNYTARFTKEFQPEGVFGYVVDPEGKILGGYSPWSSPAYADVNADALTSGFWQPVKGSLYGVHFALVPNPFDYSLTLDHNTGGEYASVGDSVTPSVTAEFHAGETTAISWYDSAGNLVKECTITSVAEASNCAFTVPDGLDSPTLYQARLLVNGDIMDSQQFLADPTYLRYPDTGGDQGQSPLTVEPVFDNPNTSATEQKPEGATFAFGDPDKAAADGLKIDPSTGVVTWEEDSQKSGTNTYDVVMTYTPEGATQPLTRRSSVTFKLNGDMDGDGVPDKYDPDADGDGVNNDDEIAAGLDPLDPNSNGTGVSDGEYDSDGDGKTNAKESDPTGGEMPDMNGDGLADPGITDLDGNGVADLTEGPDTDNDGIPDNLDPDADGDGVNNDDEIAAGLDPLDPNSNGTGVSDGEFDSDGDGITNAEESDVPSGSSSDTNGDGLANPGITDKNGNGKADLIEGPTPPDVTDTDNDGIPDNLDPDADGDGVNNDDEIAAGLDPLDPNSNGTGVSDGEFDSDNDGKTNAEESDVPSGTSSDTDGDGLANPGITDKNGNGKADLIDDDEGLTPGEIAAIVGGAVLGSALIGGLVSHMPGVPGSSDGAGNGPGVGTGAGTGNGDGNGTGDGQGAGDAMNANGDNATGAGAGTGYGDSYGDTGDNANGNAELAMTGVSGVGITLGAAALALVLGGALLVLRRRRES